MSTNNFTPIPSDQRPANAATFNAPMGQLDAAIGALTSLTTTAQTSLVSALNEVRAAALVGGAAVTNAQLIAWAQSEAYQLTSATRDGNGVITTATAKWPDGSGGTFTATSINATWLGIDAYTITHTVSGKTVTQTAITRNGNGDVSVEPALTVA